MPTGLRAASMDPGHPSACLTTNQTFTSACSHTGAEISRNPPQSSTSWGLRGSSPLSVTDTGAQWQIPCSSSRLLAARLHQLCLSAQKLTFPSFSQPCFPRGNRISCTFDTRGTELVHSCADDRGWFTAAGFGHPKTALRIAPPEIPSMARGCRYSLG